MQSGRYFKITLMLFVLTLSNNTSELFPKNKKKQTHKMINANIIIKRPPVGSIRAIDEGFAQFNNRGVLSLSGKSIITKPPIGSVRSFDADQQIIGNPIFLSDQSALGETSGASTQFTGVYIPSSRQVAPDAGTSINQSGKPSVSILAPSGTIATGELHDGISLAENAAITVNSSFVGGNINLNNGTVTLERNLKFADNKRMAQDGTVYLNGNSLSFGGQPLSWDNHIIWNAASDLEFYGKTTLNATWYFDGDAHITGNGNIFELGTNGKFIIGAGNTLYLSNLSLTGLGNGDNDGRIYFTDNQSQLKLSHVDIGLSNNYTFTVGGIYAEGPTTIVTKNYTMTLDQNASLTVDGVTLWYDTLDYADGSNIMPLANSLTNINSKYVTYLNHGIIRPATLHDNLRTCSNSLNYYAPTIRASSYQVEMNRTTSNSVNFYAPIIRNNSYILRGTSQAMSYYAPTIRASSYQVVMNRTTSNALNFYAPTIRNNSYILRGTSQAINYYAPTIRASSYQIEVNRTTSNSVNFYAPIIRNNSYILRGTSQAMNYYAPIIRASSYQVEMNRTTSNALNFYAPTIRNNSYILRGTSQAINYYAPTIRAISYQIEMNRTTSNSVNFYAPTIRNNSYILRGTSQAMNYYAPTIRASSYQIEMNRTTSNSVNFYAPIIRNNSYILRGTSQAMNYYAPTIRASSYQIEMNRTTSNAVVQLYAELTNLDLEADGNIINSALDDLYVKYRTNSNLILYNSGIQAQHLIVSEEIETISNMRYIKEGFTIPTGKTLILNTPLRVSGNLNIADGTLRLDGDLTLAADAYLTSAGEIDAGGHSLLLSNSFVVPSVGSPLRFSSNAVIDGGGNEMAFASGAYLLVDAGVSVTLRNMILRLPTFGRDQVMQTLSMDAGSSCLTLQNVSIFLEDDYEFSIGRLYIDKDVFLGGSHKFIYASTKPMTIQNDSMLFFDLGSEFAYKPGTSNRDLVTMTDQTSRIYLNGCSLSSTSTGLRLTKGTLIFDNKNKIYAKGSTLSNAIAFGNGPDSLAVYIMPGALLDVKSGCLDCQ